MCQHETRAVYFRCEYQDPDEGSYGARDENGSWNGVIGMMVDSAAEVGLNVLDFEHFRLEAVDFFPALWNLK
jgi:hypothetical protein